MPFKALNIARSVLLVLAITASGAAVVSAQTALLTGQVNHYSRVTSLGSDWVVADNVGGFSPNDTVMVIQMGGVAVNAGNELEGNPQYMIGEPGRYEIVIAGSVNYGTGRIGLTRLLLNSYDVAGMVQIIKVRSYRNAVVNNELTCQPWDSAAVQGGVLAFMVKGVLTLNADINVSGRGFRGGIVAQGHGYCQSSDDSIRHNSYSIWSRAAGYKGEGIGVATATGLPLWPSFMRGRGTNMTGGGGGNGYFSGGGGGSNYGEGSSGDVEVPGGPCLGLHNGGRGGFPVTSYPALSNGVYMGGGGGASTFLTVPTASAGGSGGGIVIIHADTIVGNGRLIAATGTPAAANTVLLAGAGGGGGGGSVIISARAILTPPALNAGGGAGGSNAGSNGAGGGGGGGLIWTTGTYPGSTAVTGGAGGLHASGNPNLNGQPGLRRNNLNLPLNGFLFNEIYVVRNLTRIDSVCEGTAPPKITGTRPAGGSGSYSYQWQKSYDNSNWVAVAGSGSELTPVTPESQTVWFRRIVSDGAGITDVSLPVQIIVHPRITGNLVGRDTTLCHNMNPEPLYPLNSGPAGGTGIYHYQWEQSAGVADWAVAGGQSTGSAYDPASLTVTTRYRRIVTSGACLDVSTPVTVTILPPVTNNTITGDQTICEGSSFTTLSGSLPSGGASPSYTYQWMSSSDNISWTTATGTSTTRNHTPVTGSPGTTWYRRTVFSGLNNTCRSESNSVTLTAHPAITNNTITGDQTICEGSTPAGITAAVPAHGAGPGSYTYQWMSSSNGSTFTPVSGGTTEQLPARPVTADSWYRRVVTSSACVSTSNSIHLSVDPRITGFDITLPAGGHDTICTGTMPELLSGTPAGGTGAFTYSWASSTDGTLFTPMSATSQSYQPGQLTATTWFQRTVSSGACSESSHQKITVLPLIGGNSLSADQTVCNTQTAATISGGTLTGGDGRYRYLWEVSDTQAAEWVSAPGINNGATYQPPLLDRTTRFRRHVFSGEADCCTSLSVPVTITVDLMPRNVNAGPDRTLLPYQFAAILSGSFEGEGMPSWRYEYGSSSDKPGLSAPDKAVTDVYKLGFGDNTFLFTVTNGECVTPGERVTLTVPKLIIPEGLTPNNDGINDYFNVEGLEFTRNELVIINTAGAVVFRAFDYRSDDPVNAWRGQDLSGHDLPDGTYYYLLTISGLQDADVPDYKSYLSGYIILRR